MMLIDKGYYDYDFERIARQLDSLENAKSDEEIESRLARFGFSFGSDKNVEDMNAEEIQEYAMKNN